MPEKKETANDNSASTNKRQLFDESLADELKGNIPEFVAMFFVIIVVLSILYLKRQFTIAFFACCAIMLISFEKRAKAFDRIIASVVIFFIAIGFIIAG